MAKTPEEKVENIEPEQSANNIGKVENIEITDEMQRSYLDYAMSVIVSRALPDVKDGLKPVHRRILYAMHELGLTHEAKYRKSATVVGEVLGKYHPHGDIPVYDALVRLAQDFAMRYPLVDGQGNFGSVDGDPPAAMRYTESRMAKISQELLKDIEKQTVDFVDNFDATRKEPKVLPAVLPNLLLNGGSGIAVGMATNIPPHNLTEVCDAVIHLISNPEANVEDLMGFIKGPDFPTGGSIYNNAEITAAYATGKGRIVMRAKAEVEEEKNGKFNIVITELPYQVNKAQLVTRIADLVKEKKMEGISDLRDESDRRGMRVVVELKRDAKPQALLNQLYKNTSMQLAFNVNMVALLDGTPLTLTLKQILQEYIRFRQTVVTRRTQFELDQAKKRAHVLEGLVIALDHLDAVIKTIRESADSDIARKNLMSNFQLSEIQATAILDMQLRRLAALERKKIEEEYKDVLKNIAYLEDLLAHPKKILEVIETELKQIKESYGDERKTRVFSQAVGEFSEEELIPKEPTIVVVTKSGYIKRSPINTFRTQQRGGKGVSGMDLKQEDIISQILSANTHDNILFFTDKGRVYQLRVYELPSSSRISKGQAIINLINIEQGEKITSILTYDAKVAGKFLFMSTEKGVVKKTPLENFANIRRNGIVSINLQKGDKLTHVKLTKGEDDIIIVTKKGMSIKFSEKNVRPMGRDTMGVMGIKGKADDNVIAMEVADPTKDLLVVTRRGYGKRTNIKQWPTQIRGGIGVKASEVTPKIGEVVAAEVVGEVDKDLAITSESGQVIKLPLKQVPHLKRQTQGVILMRLSDPKDSVSSAAIIESE